MKHYSAIVKITILICISLLTYNAHALQGWNIKQQGSTLIYTPSNLATGKTFKLIIPAPVRIDRKVLKHWVNTTAKKRQNSLGRPLKPWVIKSEKNNTWSITNTFVNSKNRKVAVAYQGGLLKDGRAYLVQMISSQDIGVLLKYGAQVSFVLNNAKRHFSNISSNKNPQKPKTTTPKQKKDVRRTNTQINNHSATPGRAPSGLKDLRGVLVYGIQAGGMFGLTTDVIATFTDGTYSSDLTRLFAKGKAVSKARKPKRWGKWRLRGGKLELKGYRDKTFETTHGDWIARPGRANLKLNGCYGNITSASSTPYGGGTTVGNASSWCFKPNGRFSHSSTGFATSSGTVRGGTSSSRKNGGRYHINGYTAHFIYDDGKQLTSAFSYLNDKKSHIAINGKRYMGK